MNNHLTYGWLDFEEDYSTDAIPDKHILTIGTFSDDNGFEDEIAVIVHRVIDDDTINEHLLNWHRHVAQHIVNLLNANPIPPMPRLPRELEELRQWLFDADPHDDDG